MASPTQQTTTPRGSRAGKRQAILDAAAEVFAESGYERAGIDVIAERAKVSKPTVYNHFHSKELLFRESIAASAEFINAGALEAIRLLDPQCREWQSGLFALGERLVACQRSPCASSLQQQMHAEVRRDPEVLHLVRSRVAEPIIDGLAGRLAMLGNAKVLDVPDPVLAAKQFIALIDAEFPDLTELGTREISDARAREAVHAGVTTFIRAYAA
ncbi:TetR/AcrR family transcriptional regulator [Williamsia sterculiae]|uniref:TetR/AcrR family transcriptional regulator n=1 Tax=Williamsia sterculiae TaxID=1344003 RepID=UPI0009FA25EE|nr:TetR/AcrR family transcriptional regulator [Williamsia sterculiae]